MPTIGVDPLGLECVNGVTQNHPDPTQNGQPCFSVTHREQGEHGRPAGGVMNDVVHYLLSAFGQVTCFPDSPCHVSTGSPSIPLRRPQPPKPPSGASCSGGGVGVGGGFTVNVGAGEGNAGAQLSHSYMYGTFGNGSTGSSVGVATSGEAIAYAGSGVASIPRQTNPDVGGLYVGGGGSVTFTNAGAVNQLKGPFNTLNFNVGVGPASIGLSYSQDRASGVWSTTVSMGPGVGLSYSNTVTNTYFTSGTSTCGQ